MANAYKVLGQSAPVAITNTTLYTVPAATETIISSIVVCNRNSAASTFRIAIRPNGAAISNEHYLYYDVQIPGNDTFICTIGPTLDATDVITIYASTANLSFNAFGCEIT